MTARIKETIRLSVRDEVHMPIAAYAPARKKSPMYDPHVPPWSILPCGFPSQITVI
jgi:hypothetical protein